LATKDGHGRTPLLDNSGQIIAIARQSSCCGLKCGGERRKKLANRAALFAIGAGAGTGGNSVHRYRRQRRRGRASATGSCAVSFVTDRLAGILDFADRETVKAFLIDLHGDPSVTDFKAVYWTVD
jgi:hypothetical protein